MTNAQTKIMNLKIQANLKYKVIYHKTENKTIKIFI